MLSADGLGQQGAGADESGVPIRAIFSPMRRFFCVIALLFAAGALGDVQQVTAQIAVIRGRQALQGLVGQSSVQQDAGEFSASLSLSQADRQAERRQLQKIHHRRRLH